eukprot:2859243-Alexandrium_andersonii.AAC.1
MDPAFSTSTWTLTSGRRCCMTRTAAGTAQKRRDCSPQTPTAPLVPPGVGKVLAWRARHHQDHR